MTTTLRERHTALFAQHALRPHALSWPGPGLRSVAVAAIGLLLELCLPREAAAIGERSRFQVAQIVYSGGNWNARPDGARRLAWEIDKRTAVEVRLDIAQLRISDPELFRHPFLYLTGDRAFPMFDSADLARLRRHLTMGGLLFVDSAEGRRSGFDRSLRALVEKLLPGQRLASLPTSHVLYKSFYLLTQAVGRVVLSPQLEAVEQDGRVLLVYSQNDLGGAWSRDNFGNYEFPVVPGGEAQRERAFRLGINLVLYALCLDYKEDQVHVPFVLRRRRWQSQ